MEYIALTAKFYVAIDTNKSILYPTIFDENPRQVPKQQGNIKSLPYARLVELMIDAASKLKDGDEKEYLTTLIVNQMKKSYVTWNRSQVADEVIISDLNYLSGGKLKITEGVKILEVKELLPQAKKKPQGKTQNKQQNKHYNKKKGHSRH